MTRFAESVVRSFLACALIVAFGCSRNERGPDLVLEDSPPVAGGELVVALQSDGQTLDPHRATDAASMRLAENLYGTLMRYTEVYGDVEPDLAESVEMLDDGRTYVFHLRRDVRFHSGRLMTAEDVRYSLNRIREKEVRAEQFSAIESMETPDAHTLVMRLSRPVAPLLTYLAYPMNAIVDRTVVEANDGRLDRVAGGTGPFRLVEWKKDRHLIMERHPDYHEPDRPFLDRIILRPIPDETARSTALRIGEVHLLLNVPDKDRSILRRARGIVIDSVPGTFWEYVGMNTRRAPFDDVRVRRAVAWALDRSMLNRMVKFGRATPLTGGVFPSNHWAHTDAVFYPQRDMARARALLQEAGQEEGFTATLRVGSAFPYQVAAAQIVKQQLAELGIDLELRAEESSVFFDALGRGDFDMTLVGWLGFVDPDEWLYNLFHSEGKWNQQGYSNAEVDDLLVRAREEGRQARRKTLYAEAQELIFYEAPVALLYLNDQTVAHRTEVRGFKVHPTGSTRSLRNTWLVP